MCYSIHCKWDSILSDTFPMVNFRMLMQQKWLLELKINEYLIIFNAFTLFFPLLPHPIPAKKTPNKTNAEKEHG